MAHDNYLELRGLGVLCFLVLIIELSYSGLTALVVYYERALQFDLVTTGWVATAEGTGNTLGVVLAALLGTAATVVRGRIAAVLVALAGAQFLSMLCTDPWSLSACRALSGICAGFLYTAGMPSIAASRNPDRGFAVYFSAFFGSGLIALVVIPQILEWFHLSGFYVLYGAALLLSVFVLRWYPLASARIATAPSALQERQTGNRFASSLLLTSLFLNFIFNGGLWVLAEHFGLEIKGTDPRLLSDLLAGTMLFGFVGTAVVTLFAHRWRHLTTIFIGNVGCIITVLIMTQWHTVLGLVVAMAFLNAAVTILTPATLASLSARNAQRGAQWGNLAAQLGYSLGPAVIASVTTRGGTSGLVQVSVAAFLISVALAWASFLSVKSLATVRES